MGWPRAFPFLLEQKELPSRSQGIISFRSALDIGVTHSRRVLSDGGSIRDKLVWQLNSPRQMTRIEVYGDSVLIEDRGPERREEQWGAVILSDSVYNRLEFKDLTIKVRAPLSPASLSLSLTGFNRLKPVFDSPACTDK
jgi:hypothetical protein